MLLSKKFIILIVCFLLIAVLWISVFTEEESKEISLKEVRLKLKDLDDDEYEKYDEEYITEIYIASEYTIFSGWKILEKYDVRYSKSNTSFILQSLGKLTSKDKAEEMLGEIKSGNKSDDIPYKFREIESETVGDETYMGKTKTILSEDDSTLYTVYFIVYRINDIIVALIGSDFSEEAMIDYARIIETNINNELR